MKVTFKDRTFMDLQLILLLITSMCAGTLGYCDFPVRRHSLLSAWQSSFGDGPTCFYNRSQSDEESVVSDRRRSYKFFHSADDSQADGGFHWFAVQLNESVLIRSVTIKGRDDGAVDVYRRSSGIEIWTSSSVDQFFLGEHCSSENMSSQFKESQQHWKMCGITESSQPDVAVSGEILTVSCATEVRQLLLRKNVSAVGASQNLEYMSAADLSLQTVELAISAPMLVAESSNFTISCSLHCKGVHLSTGSSQLQLCFPNSSCTSAHKLHIGKAYPLHSGWYTCKFGSFEKSTAVVVLCNFLIRRNRIFSSWQSSDYGQTCFHSRKSSAERNDIISRERSYRFFHSGDRSLADGGFHWFAVQLKEPVLIRSVTVKVIEAGIFVDFLRAAGIEIFTSDRPEDIFSGEHCNSKSLSTQFEESLKYWRRCGQTEKRGTVTAGELFKVDCVAEVRHLLLRRASSTSVEYMNFADLSLQTVPLRAHSPRVVAENSSFTVSCSLYCNGSELSSSHSSNLKLCFGNGSCVTDSELIIARAQPQHARKFTCQFGFSQISTTVSVLSPSRAQVVAENSNFSVSCSLHCVAAPACGDSAALKRLEICAPNRSCTFGHNLQISKARIHHSGVYRCRVDTVEVPTAVAVLYSATPPEIVNLAPTVYEGVRVTFSVRSGDGNPKVNLSCFAQSGSIESLGASQNSAAMGFTPDRRDTSVQCSAVQMYNSRTVFSRSCSQNVSVMYSANNSLLTSPSAHITEGSDLSVTLVSVGGRPSVRNLSCWAGGVPLTAENNTFGTESQSAGRSVRHLKLEAVNRSLNGKLLSCVFEQDDNLMQWKNTSLAVFYPVQNASIRLSASRVRSGSAAQFALLASDWGNPPARHFCHLAERTLQQEPMQSSIEASKLWKFTPLDTDNGLRISCQLLQIAPTGLPVFNVLAVSGALNVLYEAQSEWTATQLQLLREGEHLAVSLTSLGGNPEPSHRCWQQTADGHVISVSHLLKQSRRAAQLETSFRVRAERWMNGGCVICKVIQEGLGDGERIFQKNLSVIFPSRVISWSGGLLNGSELNLTVETSEGNPRPMLSCSLSPGSFGSERLTVIPEPDRVERNRGWIRRARLTHRFTEQQAEVTVACLLSQPYLDFVNFFPSKERKTFRAVFPSARWSSPSSGRGAIAALCCSLAAAVAVGVAVTAAVLKRMRAAAAAGRRGAMELSAAAKPADPNTVYYDEGN